MTFWNLKDIAVGSSDFQHFQKSAVILMGFPLEVTCCFSFAAFNTLSLFFVLVFWL